MRFRLSLLLDPAYVAARLKTLRSPRDLAARVGRLFVYLFGLVQNSWYAARGLSIAARRDFGRWAERAGNAARGWTFDRLRDAERAWYALRGAAFETARAAERAAYAVRGWAGLAGARVEALGFALRGAAAGAAKWARTRLWPKLQFAYFEATGRYAPRLRDRASSAAFAAWTAVEQTALAVACRVADAAFDRDLARRERRFARRLEKPSAALAAPPAPPHETHAPCRVHLSWNIHVACNYDCSYCWFHDHWDEFKAANRYLPPAEWAAHWKRFNERFGPARVDIAGGEPFTYPRFLEILEAVSRENVVMISTNLSWGPDKLIARIDPKRVGIAASFHPEFVGSESAFLDKIARLRAAGFHASVSMVAYPPSLPRLLDFAADCLERGIELDVEPFRGRWKRRLYPESYTPGSRRLLKTLISGTYKPPVVRGGLGSVSWPMALEYQLGRRKTLGQLCNAGVRYARLQADGKVTRCAQGGGLVGDFFSSEFKMDERPLPCPFARCECINEVLYIAGGPLGPEAGS